MVKIYDKKNVLVFEKRITKFGKNRIGIEIPAKIKKQAKVRLDVEYLVILVPIRRIIEEEF